MWSYVWQGKDKPAAAAGGGGAAASSNASGQYMSSKLLSSVTSAAGGRTLVVHQVDNCLASVRNSHVNLISIFGRARQGKSFLMNCLSGEIARQRISSSCEPKYDCFLRPPRLSNTTP